MYRKSLVLIALVCCLLGCGSPTGTPTAAVVGRYDRYDYSPSIIQDGSLQKFWWCGRAQNPADSSQDTDAILYESIDVATKQKIGPMVALAETPGAWDSEYTCNPNVIQGVFANPLGDGETYLYAMYYVGTELGSNNSIGAAFSKDGVSWKKYPSPVVPSTYPYGYGPAQPVARNSDQKQAITLFYEDDDPSGPPNHHFQATSTDGIHFTTQGILTTNGLDLNNPKAGWGDIAYDPTGQFWYATYNLFSRDPSTTGNITEIGSFGLQLYRIPKDDLLVGNVGWQLLKNYDTNLTGYEMNSGAGLLRDTSGNLYPGTAVQLFPSFSNPAPAWNASPQNDGTSADPSRWDIGSQSWSSTDTPMVPLNRYKNSTTHFVTTGWTDPGGNFVLEQALGHLYVAPQNGALTPLYGCKAGNYDNFVSLDHLCENQRILGVNGYLYAQPVSGLNLVAIYRCASATDHFVSKDPQCEGATSQGLLGYILPESNR